MVPSLSHPLKEVVKMSYKIVRHWSPIYNKAPSDVTDMGGLTLQEAQAHCQDPDTRKEGEWFDGYTEE